MTRVPEDGTHSLQPVGGGSTGRTRGGLEIWKPLGKKSSPRLAVIEW